MTLLDHLHASTPFASAELMAVVGTAPRRYKVYGIPKKNSTTLRVIAQPAPEVKLIQRILVRDFIGKWPIHSAATAYRASHSIRDHAEVHADSRFLLKMDFANFFPSITQEDIRHHAVLRGGMSEEDARLLSWLVSWRDKTTGRLALSIGAPSSPAISNSILYDFDLQLTQACEALNVRYSRYADDLAFSTSRTESLREIESLVFRLTRELPYPRLSINERKTVNVSSRHRRELVGLVLSSAGGVSLGRERKRMMHSLLHSFKHDKLPSERVGEVRGLISFAWSIEPRFVQALAVKYGDDTLSRLGLPFASPLPEQQ